jgi:hypothetical protein
LVTPTETKARKRYIEKIEQRDPTLTLRDNILIRDFEAAEEAICMKNLAVPIEILCPKISPAGSCMRIDFGDGDIFEGLEYKRAKKKALI